MGPCSEAHATQPISSLPRASIVIGNEHWVEKLETSYLPEFLNHTATPFMSDKKEAGYVRSAGEGAGNIAFVGIFEAGHMVCSYLLILPCTEDEADVADGMRMRTYPIGPH